MNVVAVVVAVAVAVAVVVALADDFMPTMLIFCTQIQRTPFDRFLGAWPAGYTLFCGY